MILKEINKNIVMTLGVLLVVSFSFVGFTQASFKVAAASEETVLNFGDIALSVGVEGSDIFNYGNVIGTKTYTTNTGEKATGYIPRYPIEDPVSEEDYEELQAYFFKVTNNGDYDLYLTFYLDPSSLKDLNYTVTEKYNEYNYNKNGSSSVEIIKDENKDEEEKEVDEIKKKIEEEYMASQTFTQFVDSKYFKYFNISFGEAGSTPTVLKYSDVVKNGYLADNIFIENGSTKYYKLYLWLSEEELEKDANKVAGELIEEPKAEDFETLEEYEEAYRAYVEETGIFDINQVIGKYFVTELSLKGEYIPDDELEDEEAI